MHDPTLSSPALSRITRLELPICRYFNSIQNRQVLRFFSAISWLGNGVYYAVILLALWFTAGSGAPQAIFHFLTTGAVCLALYKALKNKAARPRPFDARPGFHLTVAPLDKYSFPSGHTLHAVGFTLVLSVYAPVLFLISVPFAILVALSRLILGLHYPTDVAAGAVLGSTIAWAVLQVSPPF